MVRSVSVHSNIPMVGLSPSYSFQVVKHADVHIQLTDILMRDFFGLQLDDDEAFQDVIVEYQVDEEIGRFRPDMFCLATKANPLPSSNRNCCRLLISDCSNSFSV